MRTTAKKALVLFFAVLIAVCSLSGCVRMKVGLDIKADGSADMSVNVGVANEVYSMLQGSESDPFAQSKQEAETNGYTVEEYDADGYKGIIMTGNVPNLEEASSAGSYVEGITFTKQKNGLKHTMNLSGTLASVQSLKQNMVDSQVDVSQFDLTLTVTTPYPITSSNAAQVSEDKRTATWDLTQAERIELTCAGDVTLFGMPVAVALCIVGGLAVIAVVLIVVGAIRKKNARRSMEEGAEPVSAEENNPEN